MLISLFLRMFRKLMILATLTLVIAGLALALFGTVDVTTGSYYFSNDSTVGLAQKTAPSYALNYLGGLLVILGTTLGVILLRRRSMQQT